MKTNTSNKDHKNACHSLVSLYKNVFTFFAKQVKHDWQNWNPRFEENSLLAVSLVFQATNRKT